ncbi:cryptochrome/photolyase family protein [Botrimarina mediterranea]|uniref:Deoxyribodipyrimidine photo-lyase-related protein n=1 Tax=Botrimarina mediterranea TaxID=2528022 RepID=A0A518K6N4_9BACT|nr:cryptochrome/photolyase family protein [Botrimarina mediterranea]QDV73462.1 Deoxyribodipyrimidine photo-lyase-related protein [Botrimarina mediterranea]QDV77979.1 Deoxyribodipyrimidine photo-lyase-related protein [Planctomycetes bacterium K2D]
MVLSTLALILGDQLDRQSPIFEGFDPKRDVVWMAEVAGESTHVWSHKVRTVFFLTAMRHFRDELKAEGIRVDYRELPVKSEGRTRVGGEETLAAALRDAIDRLKPLRLVVVHPGEWRVREELRLIADEAGLELVELDDTHFYTTPDDFARHANGRKQLRLEFFYRELRKRLDILMEDGAPVGGEWNYDKENRGAFGKKGPGKVPAARRFKPDTTTQAVIDLVNERFAEHPGTLDDFDWPVSVADARLALKDFIRHRLPSFGEYQDAMWTAEPWLYHSRLSAAMNVKLLDPREVVDAAVAAYESGAAPLEAVEGFVRQILGWREYVRGIYWTQMPKYLERNALRANEPLPNFYWTGETDYACLRDAIGQTLQYGYAHHIQRLMVTGLFAMMLGVDPQQVHEWYLAVYIDAVEWVELPNTLGMSQHADGGLMASKPYCATGKYLQRMSNYCAGCRYDPAKATGDDACPFTTLYWDFLARHRDRLAGNNRMAMQLKNLERKPADELSAIRQQAAKLREQLAAANDQ